MRFAFERYEGTRRSNRNAAAPAGSVALVQDGTVVPTNPVFDGVTFKD